MPRKKGRLTPKKKSLKKEERQTPGGLSQQQFAALTNDYGSFQVEDEEHEEHEFVLGDVVYVQHRELNDRDAVPTEDYWIGEIKEIRANNPSDVWLKIQWFWSPQEVAEVIKSFDPTLCGKFEKLASNNYDFITVHSIMDRVEVKHFDETSLYQAFIEDEEWFSRFEFSYDARRVTPKVTRQACSICKVPYTPGEARVLHFCPRPSCRTFYHQACLVKRGYLYKTRTRRLLETWPDIDRTASVEELSDEPPSKKMKKDNCPSRGCHGSDPLSTIPPRLVDIAEQQIVRGMAGFGVVGNIAAVAAARSLIYKAVRNGDIIPGEWETKVDISTPLFDTNSLPNCFCPSCYSPI